MINKSNFPAIAVAVLCLTECTPAETPVVVQFAKQDFQAFYKSELFKDVQLSGMFADSKTFVDAKPRINLHEIENIYQDERENPGFDLKVFVEQYFELPENFESDFITDSTKDMEGHIEDLWPVLTREPDERNIRSSLIPLPNRYVVPGGRFREIYYWDTYFTIEGLLLSGHESLAKDMVENFTFLVDSLGFVPNGNRAYYSGRSQPPFFALMVDKIAAGDKDEFLKYHATLLQEYNFWMQGQERLNDSQSALNRVVKMPDGSILNRYWDSFDLPRPESFREDYQLVKSHDLPESETYRHIRAAAESGWDFSSRWLADAKNLRTINTTNIIPIDLNALLYFLEQKIAEGYNDKDELENADIFYSKAQLRKDAMNKYLWSDSARFYLDYNFEQRSSTGVRSLAAVYPLFFKISSGHQAVAVKETLENDFLKPGGFVTTLNATGQQWDSPNGWAPLQWLTIHGLVNYGYNDLAYTAAERWLERNKDVYQSTGKMMEKYNVIDTTLQAGGGEYPLQDGFGWTNGVALKLIDLLEKVED